MADPVSWLLDTSGFVPRWACGDWSAGLGYTHIAADILIWLAYLAIPVLLVWFVRRRQDLPFPRLFWLFGLFIVTCGTSHLLEAVIFYQPVYRLSGMVKLATAVASWATVLALIPAVPKALALQTPAQLEREVAARTAELSAANATLRQEVEERQQAQRELAEQREWARVVLASIADAVVATDVRNRVSFLNPAAAQLTGWPAEEAVGRAVEDVVHTLDEGTRGRIETPLARVLREGREVGLANHTILVTRSGEERIIVRRASPLRSPTGELVGAVLVVQDATEARQHELDRARLAAIVSGTDDAVVGEEMDGTVRSWNEGAERLYGWAASEMVGRTVTVLVPDDKAEELAAVKARVSRGERVPPLETVQLAKDGRRLDVSIALSAVHGVDGRVIGYAKIARDIGPRRRTEEALRESEQRFRAMADSAPVMIWVAGLDKRCTYFNRPWLEFTGRPLREELGDGWAAGVHPDDRERCVATYSVAFDARRPFELEYRLRRADGEYRWVLDRGVPRGGEQRPFLGYIGSVIDITDRRAAEERVRASEARFRQLADAMPQIVWAAGPDGAIDYLNRRWAEVTGEAAADRHALIHPDERDGYLADWAESVRTGAAFQREFRLRLPGTDEGEWYLGRAVAVRDDAGRVVRWFGTDTNIQHVKRVEADLYREREFLRTVLENTAEGILACDPDGRLTVSNRAARQIHGAGDEPLPAAGWADRYPRLRPDGTPLAYHELPLIRALGGEHVRGAEFLIVRPGGERRAVVGSGGPLVGPAGRPLGAVLTIHDRTDRMLLEDQFRQAQKMEAVGRLAAGVAHDFNNLLTVINGYAELLLDAAPAGTPTHPQLLAVRQAGERAAGLTSQLLAFSRRSVLQPKLLNPNTVVEETGKLLRRLIGEDVQLALDLKPDVRSVVVDPGQYGQVLMNLAVNARDAMPTGGRLAIATRDVYLGAGTPGLPSDLPPGRYVLTAVADTGCGMTPDVLARAFEPFFTTKEPGKGTGLGLATVYGIVRQSGGWVTAQSEVGAGTTFNVYLPAVGSDDTYAQAAPRAELPTGTETLLLVEDQEDVRLYATLALEAGGYTVLGAADGPAALALVERDRPALDLLITDVVMPGMSGRQVAEAVLALYPGLPVLFVSGYTDDAVVRHGLLPSEVAFLQKPYTPLSLALRVRELLDGATGQAGPRRPG